jgi:hypothetical protein
LTVFAVSVTVDTMKFLLALLVTFSWSVTTRAEIQVYRQAVTVTRTGGAHVKPSVFTGWIVVDDSPALTVVNVDAAHKQFSVDNPDFDAVQVYSSLAVSNIFIRIESGRFNNLVAKGTVATGVVSTDPITRRSVTDRIPLSFVVTGSNWGTDTNAVWNADEYRGSYVYDSVKTIAANKAGQDSDAQVESLRQSLIAAHYVEVEP